MLTLDRAGANANRRASLKGHQKIPNLDLDEYPPVMSKEGGIGADIRGINRSDNRGSGSSAGHQLRNYPEGTKLKREVCIMKNQAVWNNILDMISQSKKNVKIFDGDISNGEKEFNQLGLQNQSVLESIIINCSGICVDNWLRIYGQNQNFKIEHKMTNGMIIVGQDIVGGIFSINATDDNKIYYFAPDNLQWESMDMTYSEFIDWTVAGDTDGFYSTMRWKNWKNDCKEVDFDKMIMIYPFLWAKECNIETASKKAVSSKELMELNLDTALKFDGM